MHALMKDLRVGPYKNIAKFSISDVVAKYKNWIIAVAILLLGVALAVIRVAILNNRLSTSKILLEKEVDERIRAESAEHKQLERMQALYEVSYKSGLNLDEQIDETLKLGCRLFGLEIGRVCEVDAEHNENKILNVMRRKRYRLKKIRF